MLQEAKLSRSPTNVRFHLQVENGINVKATITGLRMAHVTTPFPLMKHGGMEGHEGDYQEGPQRPGGGHPTWHPLPEVFPQAAFHATLWPLSVQGCAEVQERKPGLYGRAS